jgi:hypothetical protein
LWHFKILKCVAGSEYCYAQADGTTAAVHQVQASALQGKCSLCNFQGLEICLEE